MEGHAMKINIQWINEEKRIFSILPKALMSTSDIKLMECESMLDLLQFVIEDLQWLLSLKFYKFWSYLIYSEEACALIKSVLRVSNRNLLQNVPGTLSNEVTVALDKIEHLVFLIFVRMCTDKELLSHKTENVGHILSRSSLFSVPVLLDVCSIYGINNFVAVTNIVNKFLEWAGPSLQNELSEIVPSFFHILKLLEDQFRENCKPNAVDRSHSEMDDMVKFFVHLLYDSLVTIETFLNVYPKGCSLFCTCEFLNEISSFYSNVLPEIHRAFGEIKVIGMPAVQFQFDLIDCIRIDLLKIVRNIFCYLKTKERSDAVVDEYLTLMMELLSEPTFLFDYNNLYPVPCDIHSLTKDCSNVDAIKKDRILNGVRLLESKRKCDADDANGRNGPRSFHEQLPKSDETHLASLVAQVKDILPHLSDEYVVNCLKLYDLDTEKVIAVALESGMYVNDRMTAAADVQPSVNYNLINNNNNYDDDDDDVKHPVRCFAGESFKPRPAKDKWNDAKREWSLLGEAVDKQRYSQWFLVEDETYQDEYDDSFDAEEPPTGIVKEEEYSLGRGKKHFVTPREATGEEGDEDEDEDDEEKGDDVSSDVSDDVSETLVRGRREPAGERSRGRDVVGKPPGRGQSKQVERNRAHKESHKSYLANHNRKRQAGRKRLQGMIPS